MVPPTSQNTVAGCSQITLLMLYYISSRMVNFLKVIDVPVQVSNIVHLPVSNEFISFSFLINILLFPEMSNSLVSYIVQFIQIVLIWIL